MKEKDYVPRTRVQETQYAVNKNSEHRFLHVIQTRKQYTAIKISPVNANI